MVIIALVVLIAGIALIPTPAATPKNSFWDQIFALTRNGREASSELRLAPALANSPIQFGDTVRVRRTPQSEAAGVAGKVGTVYGQTTPSATGVNVIGTPAGDYAINVSFDDPHVALWFAESELELVRSAPPMHVTVGKDGKLEVRMIEPSAKEKAP